MAKPAESAGSDISEMKALFKLAHSKPVNVALAIGGDGKAIIKLDKMMKGKALGKGIKGSDPKAKNILCGIVEIDPSDSTTAKFTMDKAAAGLEAKLIQALKGSGVSKVNLGVGGGDDAGPGGDASDDEDADDGASAGAATAAADTPAQPSTPDSASPSPPPVAAAAPPPAPPVPPAAGAPAAAAPAGAATTGPDAGTLTTTLTGLVKQMMTAMSGNPALKATLVPLATSAQGALKQGNLQQASTAITTLQQALAGGGGAAPAAAGAPPPPTNGATPPPPPNGATPPTPANGAAPPPPNGAAAASPPPGAPPSPDAGGVKPSDTPAGKAHAKAGIAWKATHAKMTGDIDQLTSKFTDAFKDHAQAAELQKAFKSKIDGVLGKLDQSLSAKLGELDGAKDSAAHAKIVADAKKILAQYQQTVSSDPTIAQLDKNPFGPMSLQKTLTTTLSTLAKVLV